MTDRRRINGPPSGTTSLVFASQLDGSSAVHQPSRKRQPKQHRKIFLRTGLTPSASGSAYLELQSPPPPTRTTTLLPLSPSLKLSCTVHGPKPLPRSAPFSPQLVLSTFVKFAPFALRGNRRGFQRDAGERDLGVHLEAALRGVIIGDRWPKSGVDVVVTVLEAEEEGKGNGGVSGVGMMTVLAGCITVASAAIVEAGIDCVDLITGGVAALVGDGGKKLSTRNGEEEGQTQLVVDPSPSEHEYVAAACVVGYLPSRDEITEMWMKGDSGDKLDALIDSAVHAALSQKTVLAAVLKESVEEKYSLLGPEAAEKQQQEPLRATKKKGKGKMPAQDVEMSG